jgi:Fe-S cluster assembly iron-binding protein IscA
MLALTDDAIQVIEGILNAPGTPDGAGLRFAPPAAANGADADASLEVTVADAPAVTDSVIDERGARIFVDRALADDLDDKLLDASVSGEVVRFAIGEQA